jgi:hypothetical protein
MHHEIQQAVETLYDSIDILTRRVPLENKDEFLKELEEVKKVLEEVIEEIKNI